MVAINRILHGGPLICKCLFWNEVMFVLENFCQVVSSEIVFYSEKPKGQEDVWNVPLCTCSFTLSASSVCPDRRVFWKGWRERMLLKPFRIPVKVDVRVACRIVSSPRKPSGDGSTSCNQLPVHMGTTRPGPSPALPQTRLPRCFLRYGFPCWRWACWNIFFPSLLPSV